MTFKEYLIAEAKKRKKKHQGLPIFPVGAWLFDKSQPATGAEAPVGDGSTDGGGE